MKIFLEKAKQLSKDYVNDNNSLVFIDNDLEKVEKVSNYVAWISHGQSEDGRFTKSSFTCV